MTIDDIKALLAKRDKAKTFISDFTGRRIRNARIEYDGYNSHYLNTSDCFYRGDFYKRAIAAIKQCFEDEIRAAQADIAAIDAQLAHCLNGPKYRDALAKVAASIDPQVMRDVEALLSDGGQQEAC